MPHHYFFCKKRLSHLASLLLWLLLALPATASHLLGGEMSYRYLDAGGPVGRRYRYELTVGMYINADTIPGSTTLSQVPTGRPSLRLGIYQKGGAGAGPAVDYPILPRVSMRFATPQPAPGCPPTTPVRLIVYRDTVALPLSAAGYYVYLTDGTRNASIRNIDQPTHQSQNENMTLFLDMAPPTLPNASPTFADTAVALVCQGDTALIINNATDRDGDRLAYSFGTPYSASPAGVNGVPPAQFVPPPVSVLYAPGYSQAQPFGTGAGNLAQLDASTGLSQYCMTSQGRYVVAVDVSEYRTIDGTEVLVGRTRRDVQLVVRLCPAGDSPRLLPPTLLPRSYTLEEGDSLRFPIDVTTRLLSGPVTMKVNSALLDGAGGWQASFHNSPGVVAAGQTTGIVNLQGLGTVGGHFRLRTGCGAARATPYDVLVSATSQDCRKKTAADVFRITITKAPVPRLRGDTLICDPSQVYTYTPVGPALGRYRWQVRGGSIVGSDSGSTVQVRWAATASAGTLSLRGQSRFGCPLDSVLRLVAVRPAAPLAVTGLLQVCPGGSTTLSATGGSSAYTLSGGGQTLSSYGTFSLTPDSTTTYTIASTSAAGCPLRTTVTVTVDKATPLAVVAATPLLCLGSSTTLSVSGGAGAYTLTGGGQTLTGAGPFPVTPTATTTYTVSGTSAAGCPLSGSATVTVAPAPVLTVSGNLRICPGGSATLLVSGGAGSYVLSDSLQGPYAPGGLLSSTGVFTLRPRQTTTYIISGAMTTGCVGVTIVTVLVAAVPELQVQAAQPSICEGDSTTLRVAGGTGNYMLRSNGQWLAGPGAGPFVVQPSATTTYQVDDVSVSGCPFSVQLQVLVQPCAKPLKFYNIITPNHDGLNDVFIIENVTAPAYAGNTLRIFNRWGREVYNVSNYQNDWGREAGVAPGVYGYLFRLPNGQVTKGWVEVVR